MSYRRRATSAPADARSIDRLQVIDLDAGDILQRQHAACRVFPKDICDIDAVIVREISRKAVCVAALRTKSSSARVVRGKFLVQSIQVGVPGDWPVELQPVGRQAQRGQISLDEQLDPRPLHLYDYFFTVAQPRQVDLGQRRRGLRLGESQAIDLLNRSPELPLDDPAYVFQTSPQALRPAGRAAPR